MFLKILFQNFFPLRLLHLVRQSRTSSRTPPVENKPRVVYPRRACVGPHLNERLFTRKVIAEII